MGNLTVGARPESPCVAARLVPHVAQQRASRRIGLRPRRSPAPERRSAGLTPLARRARVPRSPQRARGPRGQAHSWEWTGSPGQPAHLDYLQMRQQSLGPMTRRCAQVTDRLVLAGSAPGVRRPSQRKMSDPSTGTAAHAAAVAVLSCCTRESAVRIRPLTCGAKRARTADLLHAIWRQHVHPRPSMQVTVLPRPRRSARVRTSCGTFLLYRCHPRGEPQSCPR